MQENYIVISHLAITQCGSGVAVIAKVWTNLIFWLVKNLT